MTFIIELGHESVSACRKNGTEISRRSKLFSDLDACTGSGDAEPSCRYVLDAHKPEFRIVKRIDGEYKNVLATPDDKREVCEAIYFDSESNFDDESICDLYLVWEAAHDVCRHFAS